MSREPPSDKLKAAGAKTTAVHSGVRGARLSGYFPYGRTQFRRSCLLLREIFGGELGELVLGPLAFAQAEADGVFADGFFE